jgi:hypothetical protein
MPGATARVTFVHGIASAVGNDGLMNTGHCDKCGTRHVRSVDTGDVFARPPDDD